LTAFDRTSRAWVKKDRHVSSITVRSGGRSARGADMWAARSIQPLPLRNVRLGWTSDFQGRDKNGSGGVTVYPTPLPSYSSLRTSPGTHLSFLLSRKVLAERRLHGQERLDHNCATGGATKKAKTADADPPTVGNWVQTKFGHKELASTEKIGLLKNDPAEILIAGLEIIPRPPTGFRVIFLAFLLRGLSFPLHPFLCGLLFAYGIQLHDLNPNTILHIACFVTLCECFLGIEPHWALWRRIFVIRRPLHYQTGGFSCQVHQDVDYFNLQTLENNPRWRKKWFYAKDKPSAGQNFGLEEFWPTTVIWPRASWAHELSEEEMKIT
jgi:hypothetical protein